MLVDPEPRRPPVAYDEQPCKSALNAVKGMPFRWSLNPYTGCEHRCTFCYVRAFERRAQRPSGDAYGRSIRVKVNIAQVLRAELARPSWGREQVAVGAATDPYQPAEGRFRLTRGCLGAFAAAASPASLITRGPMVVRDIDVLTDLARRAEVSVTFSIPTLDHDVWRRSEPGTAPPRQRLRALERLAAAGIRCGISMAPILPGLSDRPEQLEEVVRAARESGARYVWSNLLYLREGTREHFLASVERYWPELVSRYRRDYAGRAYLPSSMTAPLQDRVAAMWAATAPDAAPRPVIRPAPAPQQLSLLPG